MVLTLVVVVRGMLNVHARQITEGELAEGFGVMRRQHQAEVIDPGRWHRRRWLGLRHLAMYMSTADEWDRSWPAGGPSQ